MSDIFISYAQKDRSRVRPLADALSGHGWTVWWDRQIPAGASFDQVIAEALDSARCVVVVWSRDSVASHWVREEADEGRKRGVLIPVLIDEVSPPLGFGRIHAAPLVGWDGARKSEAFQKLAADVARVIGAPPDRPAAPRTAAPKSPEPLAVAAQTIVARPERTGLVVAITAIAVGALFSAVLNKECREALGLDRRGEEPPPAASAAQDPEAVSVVFHPGSSEEGMRQLQLFVDEKAVGSIGYRTQARPLEVRWRPGRWRIGYRFTLNGIERTGQWSAGRPDLPVDGPAAFTVHVLDDGRHFGIRIEAR